MKKIGQSQRDRLDFGETHAGPDRFSSLMDTLVFPKQWVASDPVHGFP